jgi:hypothetical protein
VDPVPDPLLLRKSGSAGNRTQTSGSVATGGPYSSNSVLCVAVCCRFFGGNRSIGFS